VRFIEFLDGYGAYRTRNGAKAHLAAQPGAPTVCGRTAVTRVPAPELEGLCRECITRAHYRLPTVRARHAERLRRRVNAYQRARYYASRLPPKPGLPHRAPGARSREVAR
jgi:hypothetical protein